MTAAEFLEPKFEGLSLFESTMIAAMAWTEEQKADGRVELARRKAVETASTYRASCIKAVFWAFGCMLVIVLAIKNFNHHRDWFSRSEDSFLITAMLVGVALSGTLAYVRFLDWRRKVLSGTATLKKML